MEFTIVANSYPSSSSSSLIDLPYLPNFCCSSTNRRRSTTNTITNTMSSRQQPLPRLLCPEPIIYSHSSQPPRSARLVAPPPTIERTRSLHPPVSRAPLTPPNIDLRTEEGQQWVAYLKYKFEKRDDDEDELDKEEDYAFGGRKSRCSMRLGAESSSPVEEERLRRMRMMRHVELEQQQQQQQRSATLPSQPSHYSPMKMLRSISTPASPSSSPVSYTSERPFVPSSSSSPPCSYTYSESSRRNRIASSLSSILPSSPSLSFTFSSVYPSLEAEDEDESEVLEDDADEDNHPPSSFSDDEDDEDTDFDERIIPPTTGRRSPIPFLKVPSRSPSPTSSISSSTSSTSIRKPLSSAKKEWQRLQLSFLFGFHRFKKSMLRA